MAANSNPSLQKKTAARVAAVQSLYRQSITEDKLTPAAQVKWLKERLANNRDEQKLLIGMAVEPNYPLVEKLLTGVAANASEIEFRLESALTGSWKRERMSNLVVAILRCAIFEMFFGKEIAATIVIDEYTRLSRSFFADKEVNFVHGALSSLSQKYG